jgi:hypothetical protein
MRLTGRHNKMSYLEEQPDTLETQLETWRSVVGFEDRYEVSDEGRVRSLNFRKQKGLVVVMKTITNRDGYSCLSFGKKNIRVHSLVAESFIGPRPDGYDVNHKNGVKSDNRASNLEYCTESENTKHSFDNSLQIPMRGESHYRTSLTEEDVQQIIRLAKEGGISQAKIADMFGLKQQAISKIKLGLRWTSIRKEEKCE